MIEGSGYYQAYVESVNNVKAIYEGEESKGIRFDKEIEISVNKMAVGDYNISIEYESKDELGALSDSMRKMTSKTKDIINDIVRVLGEVALGNI